MDSPSKVLVSDSTLSTYSKDIKTASTRFLTEEELFPVELLPYVLVADLCHCQVHHVFKNDLYCDSVICCRNVGLSIFFRHMYIIIEYILS